MKYLKQFYTTPDVAFFAVTEEENFLSPNEYVPGGAGGYDSPDEINDNGDY